MGDVSDVTLACVALKVGVFFFFDFLGLAALAGLDECWTPKAASSDKVAKVFILYVKCVNTRPEA